MVKKNQCKKKIRATMTLISILFLAFSIVHRIAKDYKMTKEILLSTIYLSYFGHLFYYFIELPFLQIFVSLSIQITLQTLVRQYPNINLNSLRVYYAIIAYVLNFLLIAISLLFSHLGCTETVISYLITSLSPVCFLCYSILGFS